MTETCSRRDALKKLALVAGVAVLPLSHRSEAAELPHVAASDPMALGLAYVENAKSVDVSKYPTYKPEQKCSTCLQSKGQPSDAWVPCNLFPGKLVNAGGWCKVYIKKA